MQNPIYFSTRTLTYKALFSFRDNYYMIFVLEKNAIKNGVFMNWNELLSEERLRNSGAKKNTGANPSNGKGRLENAHGKDGRKGKAPVKPTTKHTVARSSSKGNSSRKSGGKRK